MKSLISLLSIGATLLTSIALLPAPVAAKKDSPTIKSTTLKHPLQGVFYFDDSDVIIGIDGDAATVYRSDDAGETWTEVNDEGQAGNSWQVWPHTWDNKRAYILGPERTHWVTTDQGKSWKPFKSASIPFFGVGDALRFHGRDAKKVILNGESCLGVFCEDVAYYTEDDFATAHVLGFGTRGCHWAVGDPLFGQDIAKGIEDRIFCVKQGLTSGYRKDNKLVVSDDHFNTELEPALDNDRAVSGIIRMAAVKKYIVAAAKSEGTAELALYVTDDSSHWHRAEFGQHKIEEDAYTLLESTNYSMQIDVLGSRSVNPLGYLFTSNSNGTYFTRNIDHTNRDNMGRVDFEKIQNIQGIVLVNIVENAKDVQSDPSTKKTIVSQISFDDGRTFEDLKVGNEKLHLHSITDAPQDGKIFSSPAPGIVMGNGNTGKSLKAYGQSDLYVSDDAGRNWRKALDGTHLYEFGNNGAILIAVEHKKSTKHIQYSLNHGKDWTKVDLEETIKVDFITTVPDSTTRKFLMMGLSQSGSKLKWHVFKIDFDGLHERTCGDKDFEKWTARVDDDGKPSCIMGHKQFFRRRKADADCLIDADFKDPQPEYEPCVCTEQDFECDFNFVRDPNDRSKCNPVAPLQISEGQCKKESDTFKGSSGWRLIPGNDCIRKNGVELDKEIERPCSDALKKPANGQIVVTKNDFEYSQFHEWHYLPRSDTSTGDDETIVMRVGRHDVVITRDHGKTWKPILKGQSITAIEPNPFFHDQVYFLTNTRVVHYTIDRGDRFHKFKAQKLPSTRQPRALKFHPDYKDWMLWYGSDEGDRHTNIYYTKDRGDDWQTLRRAVFRCEFIRRDEQDNLIFCAQHEGEDPSKALELRSSDNFFANSTKHFDNVVNFATMSEFIVVATKLEENGGLQAHGSVDGRTFADAKFPNNFHVDHQTGYTVLDSSTHAVFMHVAVSFNEGAEYGTILKSNSNGTSYVVVVNAVNQDASGYVDFEKMQGLEGVAMVNIVHSPQEVKTGAKKKLKSRITHNDGAEWAPIPPPKTDPDGKAYSCVGSDGFGTDTCSLHLHSYTERIDKSATFSSPSAIGLMLGVGNVGEFLGSKSDDDTATYISRDAGVSWKAAKKGPYLWEYGDQGSIIVIVSEAKPTRSLFYTLNEGEKWEEYEFSKVDMTIEAITTVPTDNSFNFLLWGRVTGERSSVSTVNIDFSQLTERQSQCKLDENNPTNGDYELWEPKHPTQKDNCLFGHVAQYHRKRIDALCYNGKKIEHLHNIVKNCSCTRQDYECDYNFEVQSENDKTCRLVAGLEPKSHEQYCKDNPDQREYWDITGYRKIPLSTCEGGAELDKITVIPCPGFEEEFQKKHGISGVGMFFAIVIPVGAASAIGYWVWQQYQKYGFGSFGQIRLGESISTSRSAPGQSALIAIPVALIAGTWAVAKAIPLLASSLFRSAKGYMPLGSRTGYSATGPYRSRDAFSSRRQDFSTAAFVEDDELLGDEDELEADEV